MAQLLSSPGSIVLRDDTAHQQLTVMDRQGPQTRSGTMRARGEVAPTDNVATLTGRVNRRGPALPGLRNSTPSRVAISGLCEWPAMTMSTWAATGSIASAFTSCVTWI